MKPTTSGRASAFFLNILTVITPISNKYRGLYVRDTFIREMSKGSREEEQRGIRGDCASFTIVNRRRTPYRVHLHDGERVHDVQVVTRTKSITD